VSVVANVAINVDSRNAVSKLRQVQSQAKITEKAFDALTSAAAAFGVGFAISKVIQDVKELDTNLRRLGTVGGDVAALDKGLGALSDRLDGVANKAELAAASYQALSAGFTETGANLRVVEAATKAAVGGLVDVTSVVEVTTKTLNAYGMSGDQAVKVTDSISKAIEFGQVQWSDYTSQLGRVASIAAIAGVSLDEVNAFIAAATKNGATAEVAFTGLGATLNTLLQPTKASQEAAAALGIQWDLAALRGKGFSALLQELGQRSAGNTQLAAELLGSQEALRGAFAAASRGGQDYATILAGLGNAAGKTDSDFQAMRGSLENQLKALDTAFKNLSEALGVAFGPTVVKTIGDVADAVNVIANALNAIPQPAKSATAEIIKLVAQMLLLQQAMQAIIGLQTAFTAAMVGMAGKTTAFGAASSVAAVRTTAIGTAIKGTSGAAALATPKLVALAGAMATLAKIGIIAIGIKFVFEGIEEFGTDAFGAKSIDKARREMAERRGLSYTPGPALTRRFAAASQYRSRFAGARDAAFALARQIQPSGPRPSTTADGGGAATAGDSSGSKASSQARQIKDITNQELELRLRLGIAQRTQNEQQEAYYNKQLAILQANQQEIGPNERKVAIFEAVVQYAERLRAIEEQRNKETLPEYISKLASAASGYESVLDYSKQLTEQQKQQQLLADGISNTVGQGMTSAFNALIQGSEDFGTSLRRIASGVLIDIANQLLQVFVIQKAINAIGGLLGGGGGGGFASGVNFNPSAFGMNSIVPGLSGVGNFFGGFRAGGGPVSSRKSYVVGEKGPELFIPNSSGTILPNSQLGGDVSITVNVDASGSEVQGNESQGKALALVVSAAVQSEIVKQQRPGGLLAGTR
jgi:TP901 family phage tail tape measure protein